MDIGIVDKPRLKKPKIEKAYELARKGEPGGADDATAPSQTARDGVNVPIVRYGDVTLSSDAVTYMRLSCEGFLPELEIEFSDPGGKIRAAAGADTEKEIQVILLPPEGVELARINLLFRAVRVTASPGSVRATAEYSLRQLRDGLVRGWAPVQTYGLLRGLAAEWGLGFAANTDDTGDERHMYCPGLQPRDWIPQEVARSGAAMGGLDCWVDLYDCLTLWDPYSTWTDSGPLRQVTVAGSAQPDDGTVTGDTITCEAALTNRRELSTTGLFADGWTAAPERGRKGGARVWQSYQDGFCDCNSGTVAALDGAGDAQTYEWSGCWAGPFDYTAARARRDMFRDKLQSGAIEVVVPRLIWGITRGDRMRFEQWTYSSANKALMGSEDRDDDKPAIDTRVSGLYVVLSMALEYSGGAFTHRLRLAPTERSGKAQA